MAFKYELLESLGVLPESASGWIKELNIVSYNDQESKYDLRQWAPDHERMAKGITLSKEEIRALRDLLSSLSLDWEYPWIALRNLSKVATIWTL